MSGWWTLRSGRLTVRLHLLVPAAVVLCYALGRDIWLRYLLLLATLLLHELVHALASLALRGRRAVVRIWPVFGRADVDAFPDRREAWTALAAPLANLAVAASCLLAGGGWNLALGRAPLPDLLFTANLLMGIGDLLPLPFLDGGRALRALARR